MNSRFKFRVWDTDIKEYLVGEFLVGGCGDMIHNVVDYESFLNKGNYIIEQCTGLKDKNGNLIYEGDVVRFEIVDDDSVLGKTFERICEICFGKGDYSYSFVCKNDVYYRGYALLSSILCQEIESIEIIGNIHEQVEQKDK